MSSYELRAISEIADELLALSRQAKVLLESFDFALVKRNAPGLNAAEGAALDEVYKRVVYLIDLMRTLHYSSCSQSSGKQASELSSRNILDDFRRHESLIPLVQTCIEMILDGEREHSHDRTGRGMQQFAPNNVAPEVHSKVVRTPSSGAIGTISGDSIPNDNWMLTYDDGPHPTRTEDIIDLLGVHGASATFFSYVEPALGNPQILKLARQRGHAIGCHSWSHVDLTGASDDRLRREVSLATDKIQELSESEVLLFRCPYGAGAGNGTRPREAIARRGLINAFWNVDSKDWADGDPDSVLWRVEQQMNSVGGGIILFHDIHSVTVTVTRMWLVKYGAEHKCGLFEDFYTFAPIIS